MPGVRSDDEQGDPLISERLCLMKGILEEGEYQKALELTEQEGDRLYLEGTINALESQITQ